MTDTLSTYQFIQYTHEGRETITANIANEAPVSLTVNGKIWLTFQCTPDNLDALAVGFLFNEGYLRSIGEVVNLHICDNKDNVDVWLDHSVEKPSTWRRTSGCHGGTTSTDLRQDQFTPITSQVVLSAGSIFSLADQFLNDQTPHSESGGVHTSALADGDKLLFQLHDIGRHNTFDKISGLILLQQLKVELPIILTTGRISSDMVQKAVRIGSPLLISLRSSSQMGIQLGQEWGITLISGARRGRFNVLTHPERITSAKTSQ